MIRDQVIFNQNPLKNSGKPMITFKLTEAITFPLHYHSLVEWVYVYEGSLEVEINHQLIHLKEGDFLNIGSYHIHGFDSENKDITYRLVQIDLAALRGYESIAIPLVKTFHIHNNTKLRDIFKEIDQIEEAGKNQLMTFAKAMEIIEVMSTYNEATGDPTTLIKEHKFMEEVNGYIYNHYQEGLTLETVSQSIGYHKDYFSRKFHQCMGMHFKRYLKLFMIARAKEILLSDSKNMESIAYDCGFGSVVTFNRAFKETVGMTPSKYKMSRND